jgi:hypothetical protein
MAILSFLRTFGIIYGHLVYLLVIWYIFPRFGKYYRERSGNPATEMKELARIFVGRCSAKQGYRKVS